MGTIEFRFVQIGDQEGSIIQTRVVPHHDVPSYQVVVGAGARGSAGREAPAGPSPVVSRVLLVRDEVRHDHLLARALGVAGGLAGLPAHSGAIRYA